MDSDNFWGYVAEVQSIRDDSRLPIDVKLLLMHQARDKYRTQRLLKDYERLALEYEEYKSKIKN